MTAVLTALVGGAALLLLAAGALKLVDPTRTVGALAARGWTIPPLAARLAALAEAILGGAVVALGGHVLSALVAASYAGFTWFVIGALRSGTPVGTCGCFGEADTPPRPLHVAIDAAFAVAAAVGAVAGVDPLLDASLPVAGAAVAVAVAGYAALVGR